MNGADIMIMGAIARHIDPLIGIGLILTIGILIFTSLQSGLSGTTAGNFVGNIVTGISSNASIYFPLFVVLVFIFGFYLLYKQSRRGSGL